MALFGTFVYAYLKLYRLHLVAIVIGLVAVMSCRWTAYFAAIPMVDSLYCLSIVMTLYAIKTQRAGILLWTILLGMMAKEAYAFLLPVVLIYSPIARWRMLFYLVVVVLFFAGYHYLYDHYLGIEPRNLVHRYARFIGDVKTHIRQLFGFLGANKIFSNAGIWIVVPIGGALYLKNYRAILSQKMDRSLLFIFIALSAQVLIGTIERQLYLMMPMFALIIAITIDSFISVKKLGSDPEIE